METDTDRIDDATLALLTLGRHDEYRAWKGFDWDAMERLHKKASFQTLWVKQNR